MHSLRMVAQCTRVSGGGVWGTVSHPDLWWGRRRLPTADTAKYLRLRLAAQM